MTSLSVVIPTFNRSATLDRCLERLSLQTLAASEFEVVIADDASTDDTERVVANWADRLPVRYVRCEKSFAGGTRNRGVAVARGRRILFLGDDILAAPSMCAAHLQGEERHGAASVLIGEVRLAGRRPLPPFMAFLEESGLHHDFPRLRESHGKAVAGWYFYACNASLPASAYEVVGGFDESIQRAWEDTEFGFRLERAGFPLYFLPEAQGDHVHPMTVDRYVGFLRAGRADVVRALERIVEGGQPMEPVAEHAWLDRIITDEVVSVAAAAIAKSDRALPRGLRKRVYRPLLAYERRRAFQLAARRLAEAHPG